MKKIVTPLVVAGAVLVLGACGGGNASSASSGASSASTSVSLSYGGVEAGTYDLKVWCADKVQSLTETQVKRFISTYLGSDVKVNLEVAPVGEGDAASNMLTDVSAGADIYSFPQDQLARLVNGGALSELGGTYKAWINQENDKGSIAAATTSNALYAFPQTSDNGYFLYYDKSKVTNVTNLAEMIAEAKDGGYSVGYNYGNVWYSAGIFFGNGCVSEWTTNAKGDFTAYNDTFNSDKGLAALKAFYAAVKSGTVSDTSSAGEAFGAGMAAVVSGTWDYTTAAEALGDNLGVAELPYLGSGDSAFHMGSYSGNKLIGVKPQTDSKKAVLVNQIASYLTSTECQLERFNSVAWGPSNLKAQANEAVASNPALVALAKQSNYAKPQGQAPGDWWALGNAICVDAVASDGSDSALKAILETYAAGLEGCLTKTAA